MAKKNNDHREIPEDLRDPKLQKRFLRFLNDARRPEDLQVPPDQRRPRPEGAERLPREKRHRPEPHIDRELAGELLEKRDLLGPVQGYRRIDELLQIDPDVLERLRDLFRHFNASVYGRWDLLYDMDAGGIEVESEHAALLHTYRVIFLSDGTDTFLWDPSDETNPQFQHLPGLAGGSGLTANLMCCGHSFLSDGKLLAVGGGGAGPGTSTSNQGWKFDPETETWERTAGDMGTLRWYPTVLTLGDESGPTGSSGRVLVASGELHGTASPALEVYSEASDTFTPVGVSGPDKGFPQTYPGLHLLPGGEIFYAPTGFGNCGTGSVYPLSHQAGWFGRTGTLSGSWTDVGASMNRTKGMSLLVLQPSYPFVQVVVVGGGGAGTQATLQRINLSTLSPSWSTPESIPDGEPRVNVNTVLLPDGTVFICGGTQDAAPSSWIYDPAAAGSPWSEMDALNVPRHYHSMVLLLPSGKVMAAAGAAPGGCTHSVNNSIEVFSPPYLFAPDGSPADRPQIVAVDGVAPDPDTKPTVHHGASFTIETPEAAEIDRVVLVRPMAVTHQTDTEQRVIRCSFSKTGTQTLTAVAPDGGHPHSIAPRGYYLLFVLDADGVPSEGKFVHLH